MISLIAKWWIQPGNEDIVVPALKKLANDVRAEEGTLLYLVHTPDFIKHSPNFTSEPVPRPGQVVFVEVYDTWPAFQDHVTGQTFTTFMRDYGKMFVQAHLESGSKEPQPFMQVEFLERIAGFVRSV